MSLKKKKKEKKPISSLTHLLYCSQALPNLHSNNRIENLTAMPSRKRAASSSLQYPRRPRRISHIPRKLNAVACIDDENALLDGTDENAFYSTDDDYRSEEEDPESEKDDEEEISASEKDIKEEEEDTDEEEDKKRVVTIIPHEMLRPLDGVEYADHKIHKNTLLYLEDLRVNNRRSWFKSKYWLVGYRLILTPEGHEKEFRRALKDWETFVETITPKVIGFDSNIPELPPKDFIFRIYRNIRFSKDQRPYKVSCISFAVGSDYVLIQHHCPLDAFFRGILADG